VCVRERRKKPDLTKLSVCVLHDYNIIYIDGVAFDRVMSVAKRRTSRPFCPHVYIRCRVSVRVYGHRSTTENDRLIGFFSFILTEATTSSPPTDLARFPSSVYNDEISRE